MAPRLLRSLKLTPVTCGFSWVSREEKSACAHTNNPPSRTDLGKSWKMLPDLLPFLPIIKIKTFEFFPSKKIRKQNIPTISAAGIWQTCKSSSRQEFELGVLLYRRNLDAILPSILGLFLPSNQTLQPGPSAVHHKSFIKINPSPASNSGFNETIE